jgi:ribonuclease HI
MYYVVYTRAGDAELIKSWPTAQASVRARRAMCRKFTSRGEAEAFVTALRERDCEAAGAPLPTCHTDGAAVLHQCAAGAAFFGPGDPRNCAAFLPTAPYTAPRAEFWAAILALRQTNPVRIITDSELLYRCYLDGFPRSWANQDLISELRELCETTGRASAIAWTPGHAGTAGNEAAHRLCSETLRSWAPATSVAQQLVDVGVAE